MKRWIDDGTASRLSHPCLYVLDASFRHSRDCCSHRTLDQDSPIASNCNGALRPMIIGTAGHIDHGKTSLVRALTGVDTDRLKEEKQRGISIELGYAYAARVQGDALGYIDVPGHERLIHTMVAGAGGIDFALLVVAADDGVMPQTREHVAILQLLGVRRGAVALTKVDRVDDSQALFATAQIRQLLSTGPFGDAPIFALNATRADDAGVSALRLHLEQAAEGWRMRSDAGLFRLPVDRVFTLPGRGTVATGTAIAGRVHVGDSLARDAGSTLSAGAQHPRAKSRQRARAGRPALRVEFGGHRQKRH